MSNDPAHEGGDDLASRLARRVEEWTRGRVQDIRVEVTPDRVVVHGRADTYYAKQLALQAAGEFSGPALVELDIRVGEPAAGPGNG